MIGYDDQPPGEENDGEMAAIEILGYSMAMAEERRGCPRDDIVTKLISAEIDGHGLSDDEFGYFVLMLAVAGNETTRNAITHGMLAFLDHPEQWELFKASRPDTAADEIVRWATPITVFQRTATRDVELGGQQVKAGDRLGLFYRSANFDEEVFDRARTVRHRPQPEPAPRLRRPGHALLPGRQPGQAGDRADLQRHRRRHAGHRQGRRPRPPPLRLDQRHQVPPRHLPPLTQPALAPGQRHDHGQKPVLCAPNWPRS